MAKRKVVKKKVARKKKPATSKTRGNGAAQLTPRDKKTLKSLKDMADGVVKVAARARAPYFDIPSRSLSNVRFNRSQKIIEMGRNTNRRELFNLSQAKSYMQTMLVYGDLLYNAKWNGSVMCFRASTGEEIWRHKAGSGNSYIASPVASDGKIYIIDDQGMVYILKAGTAYELLAQNDLGEICMATPAISGKTIFFRTINHVIAVRDLK